MRVGARRNSASMRAMSFQGIERFGDIVIGTQFESHDLVIHLSASSEQENGRGQACTADVGTDLQAAFLWKHDVQDDQIERQLRGFLGSFVPITRKVDAVSMALQAITEGHAQGFLIFHDQDIFIHGCGKEVG